LIKFSARSAILFKILASSMPALLKLHSQIIRILQPWFLSSLAVLSSRILLASSFFCHHSFRVCGNLERSHPCWCQKHPWMSSAAEYFGKTMSGQPGRSFLCSLYRRPLANSRCRSSISGFVSFPRTEAIILLRTSASTKSIAVGHLRAGFEPINLGYKIITRPLRSPPMTAPFHGIISRCRQNFHTTYESVSNQHTELNLITQALYSSKCRPRRVCEFDVVTIHQRASLY